MKERVSGFATVVTALVILSVFSVIMLRLIGVFHK